MSVEIVNRPFDVAAETAALSRGRTDIGAVVAFSGICRDNEDGGKIRSLTLEHYPEMAEAEIARHVGEAEARWPLLGLTIVHRNGRIRPGEPIVLVMTASEHRQPAFEAASFLMDYLKTRAPFWKKEHRVDGSQGEWIAAKDTDDEAAGKW